MDGKLAFLLENLGAKEVVAADLFERKTVRSLIRHFGSRVRYEPGVRDETISNLREKFGLFDFILCSGVLYHVYSPLQVVLGVRRLMKNGGCVLFESACIDDEKSLVLQFNRGDIYQDHTTIWVPSIACMRYLLAYACFEIVAEATLYGTHNGVPRHAILGRAARPSEVRTNDPWLAALHAGKSEWSLGYDYLLPHYDRGEFEQAAATQVLITPFRKARLKLKKKNPESYRDELEFLEKGTPARRGSISN